MGRQIYLPQQSIVAKTTKTTTVKISKRFRHWDPGHILQLLFANLYEKQTEVNTDCQQRELCAESLSCVQLFATPWAVAHQAPLSVGFSRQEYWVGGHVLLQEIFLTQGLNPCPLSFLHWQVGSLLLYTWEAQGTN